jgi:hypothetical protein
MRRKGYGNRSVCLSVCPSVRLSVTTLTATYLVYESKVRCYKVPYSVPNACILWISLKTFRSPALASFAGARLLDFSPSDLVLFIREVIILYTLYMVCMLVMVVVYNNATS